MLNFCRSRVPAFLAACLLLAMALVSAPESFGQSTGSASKLSITVQPQGSAAREKPLPQGGLANLKITVRNETKDTVGPVTLTAKLEGLKAVEQSGWKIEGERISAAIETMEPGASIERQLRLRVEKAPFPAGKLPVAIEAVTEKLTGTGAASLTVADCTGNFREKLSVLRPGILQEVRDTAETMRRPDTSLPGGRTFPLTNTRKSDVQAAERLSYPLSARQAADVQMATEWYRFLIARWVSELNSYATQPAHPGLCANNYYQIAGYREGLLPVTKRIETFRDSGKQMFEAARTASKNSDASDVRELVLKIAKAAEIEGLDEKASVFTQLAAIQSAIARGKKLDAEQLEALSLAETSAWLRETDKKGQALNGAIEKVLDTIAAAHKESCVCAF